MTAILYGRPEPADSLRNRLLSVGVGLRPGTRYGCREAYRLDTGEVLGQWDSKAMDEYLDAVDGGRS